jgi:hypothetical protein
MWLILLFLFLKKGFKTPKITQKICVFFSFSEKKTRQTYKFSSHNKTIGGSYWEHVGNIMRAWGTCEEPIGNLKGTHVE